MMEDYNLIHCYNRGCGQKFDPSRNDKEECRHHPGMPVFHDAYKGWSCCNKKCTDFTEFLNIVGCTLGNHSNEKPKEPEKPKRGKEIDEEMVEVKMPAPITESTLVRPSFDTPLVTLKPTVAESLKQQLQKIVNVTNDDNAPIELGTSCKNGGCSASYEGPSSDATMCVYHPGVPIFHEGLKFWSCCQKRTSDFNTFLSQPGCDQGKHKWKKEPQPVGTIKCRWDWHQTPDYVIVSIYAKQYNPEKSYVKVNPIRLNARVVFPQEGDAAFEIDLELRGIVDIDRSSVSMLGTKVEIKLRKMEPGAWAKLEIPKLANVTTNTTIEEKEETIESKKEDEMVDLSDIEAVQSFHRVNISN